MGHSENPTGGRDLLAEGKEEEEGISISRVKVGVVIALSSLWGSAVVMYAASSKQSSTESTPGSTAVLASSEETPPDPAAIQECFRRLLSGIQPGVNAIRDSHPSAHGYHPLAQALTADGQTECSATLAIQAMRVKKAARGR